jgi:hypothetical protein
LWAWHGEAQAAVLCHHLFRTKCISEKYLD